MFLHPFARFAAHLISKIPLMEFQNLHTLTHKSPFWRTYESNDTGVERRTQRQDQAFFNFQPQKTSAIRQ
jgi:hypothetical protein